MRTPPADTARDVADTARADATADVPLVDADDDTEPGRRDAGPSDSADVTDTSPADVDALADTDAVGFEVCGWAKGAAAGAARAVLVGHPFSEDLERPGTMVRRLTLRPDRTIVDENDLLDVGFRTARIAVAPSGTLAFVLGEDGEFASVRVGDRLEVLDRVTLGSAAYGDVRVAADEGLVFVVGTNATLDGGVSVVRVDCDGLLEVVPEAFFGLRLAESLVPLPDGRAVLLGGQAVFDPVDPNDIRLMARDGDGWAEVGAFDVYGDMVTTGRIAASPTGDRVLVPNSSPFSAEGHAVAVLAVDEAGVREVQRIDGMDDASEALFSPDGSAALVTLVEPGRVAVLKRRVDGTFSEATRIAGIGLPDQMAMVETGDLAGTVLIPSIDPSGTSNVAILTFDEDGGVTDRGQFDIGDGFSAIPDAIGVTP